MRLTLRLLYIKYILNINNFVDEYETSVLVIPLRASYLRIMFTCFVEFARGYHIKYISILSYPTCKSARLIVTKTIVALLTNSTRVVGYSSFLLSSLSRWRLWITSSLSPSPLLPLETGPTLPRYRTPWAVITMIIRHKLFNYNYEIRKLEHEPSYRDAKYQECRRKPVNHTAIVKAAHILG